MQCALLVAALVLVSSVPLSAQSRDLELTEEWRIEFGGGPEWVGVPLGVFRRTTREVVVTDGSSLRVIDARGRTIATTAAPGGVSSVGWSGESLFVISGAEGREIIYDEQLRPLSSHRVPRVVLPTPFALARAVRRLADGDFLAVAGVTHAVAQLGAEARVPILVASVDGTVLRAIATMGVGSDVVGLDLPSGGTVMRSFGGTLRALAFTPLHAVDPGDDRIVAVDRSRHDGIVHVFRISASGDTTSRISVRMPPSRIVPRALLAEVLAPQAGALARDFGGVDSARSVLLRALGSPSRHASVSAVKAGADGSIWLQVGAVPADLGAWQVLDADGRPMGAVRFPPGAHLVAVSATRALYWQHSETGKAFLISVRAR